MRISHVVSHSTVRNTPARIACYWGRYTEHEGRAFVTRRSGGIQYNETLNPYGYQCIMKGEKESPVEWLRSSDVIHFHDDAYTISMGRWLRNNELDKKILVYQAHLGSIPVNYFQSHKFPTDKRVRLAGITNGYGHFFDEDEKVSGGKRKWGRLPDILDLNHPVFVPQPSLRPAFGAGRLRVVYTYSNNREGGKLNAKRPVAHKRLLKGIPGVTVAYIHKKPFEESMAAKKAAHVVIEECFTPYLHLSALEGAAVGAMVLTNFDHRTMRETSDAVGAPIDEWPFWKVDENNLRKTIELVRDDPKIIVEWGEKGRTWMRKYYSPEALLKKYLEFYGL